MPFQPRAHTGASSMKQDALISLTDLERFGDLLGRASDDVAQRDDGSLRQRQLVYRTTDEIESLAREQPFFRQRGPVGGKASPAARIGLVRSAEPLRLYGGLARVLLERGERQRAS